MRRAVSPGLHARRRSRLVLASYLQPSLNLETKYERIDNDSCGDAGRSRRERDPGYQRFLDQPVHAESRAGSGKRAAVHAVWPRAMEERGHERRSDRVLPARRPIESIHGAVPVSVGAKSEDDRAALRVPNDLS